MTPSSFYGLWALECMTTEWFELFSLFFSRLPITDRSTFKGLCTLFNEPFNACKSVNYDHLIFNLKTFTKTLG